MTVGRESGHFLFGGHFPVQLAIFLCYRGDRCYSSHVLWTKKWTLRCHTYCGLFLGIATKGHKVAIFCKIYILID
nr:MAG TPA: hypothetical protein [Caudoviricetes sp.]